MVAAQGHDNPEVVSAYETVKTHRGIKRKELRGRLEELKPHLDTAIDAVELELGLELPTKAAQRDYVLDDPVRVP